MRQLLYEYKEMAVYSVIALVSGIVIGAVDALFGRVLLWITEVRELHPLWFLPFLPLAGLLIMFLYRTFSKESLKGMTLVFETGHGEAPVIPKRMLPLVVVSTWLTHLFGGSAGREGVAVQIGAVVSHTIAKQIKLLKNPRMLLVIGMAAGFAGLFQTPLAATFFAMEVLTAGILIHEIILPALIASYAASMTSHWLGLEKFSVDLTVAIVPSTDFLVRIILLGIIFGVTGGIFAKSLKVLKVKCMDWILNPFFRIFCMGAILSVFLMLLHLGRYAGLGTNLIEESFGGGQIYGYDWILKFIFTILTLAAGYQGGEVTPLFAIGAALGISLGGIFGIPLVLAAALGYAAVFGSATNTLLAPIFIGVEVFGTPFVPWFVLVCVVAFVCNGNQSIYSAQKKYSFFGKK